MNHDNERKAFEEWHKKEYADKLEWDNSKGEYKDYIDETMWQTWFASANRQGYRLVPVDPNFETMQEMNSAFIENSGETPKYRMQQVYKAMIGACDD